MPYDKFLAERLRMALARVPNIVVEEQYKMGGVTFMVNDIMCTRAHRSGGIMQRCLPQLTDELVKNAGVQRMEMRGKPLKTGWLLISPEAVDSEAEFEFWLDIALEAGKVAKPSKKRTE
ncbi:TfoX/Sxy family protein [Mucilaginibacter agri]|uniref:TfoX N-terminal domain-containing protein n=1 Tax=Mucilaginibacter agri TaxID=2695265 RepID=A0A966DR93_9SPHI|nr:TfoX/Sxy family protein [Mucilaginibacter agri]NCD68813.1 hypothetical protein [Mucilaginibacter agri]